MLSRSVSTSETVENDALVEQILPLTVSTSVSIIQLNPKKHKKKSSKKKVRNSSYMAVYKTDRVSIRSSKKKKKMSSHVRSASVGLSSLYSNNSGKRIKMNVLHSRQTSVMSDLRALDRSNVKKNVSHVVNMRDMLWSKINDVNKKYDLKLDQKPEIKQKKKPKKKTKKAKFKIKSDFVTGFSSSSSHSSSEPSPNVLERSITIDIVQKAEPSEINDSEDEKEILSEIQRNKNAVEIEIEHDSEITLDDEKDKNQAIENKADLKPKKKKSKVKDINLQTMMDTEMKQKSKRKNVKKTKKKVKKRHSMTAGTLQAKKIRSLLDIENTSKKKIKKRRRSQQPKIAAAENKREKKIERKSKSAQFKTNVSSEKKRKKTRNTSPTKKKLKRKSVGNLKNFAKKKDMIKKYKSEKIVRNENVQISGKNSSEKNMDVGNISSDEYSKEKIILSDFFENKEEKQMENRSKECPTIDDVCVIAGNLNDIHIWHNIIWNVLDDNSADVLCDILYKYQDFVDFNRDIEYIPVGKLEVKGSNLLSIYRKLSSIENAVECQNRNLTKMEFRMLGIEAHFETLR